MAASWHRTLRLHLLTAFVVGGSLCAPVAAQGEQAPKAEPATDDKPES